MEDTCLVKDLPSILNLVRKNIFITFLHLSLVHANVVSLRKVWIKELSRYWPVLYSLGDAHSPATGVEPGDYAAGGVVALDHCLGGEHVHVDHVEVDHAGGGPPRAHQVTGHVAVRDVALGSGQGLKR